ncbi:hypothetical protein S83_006462 [Arachis hypogaea]
MKFMSALDDLVTRQYADLYFELKYRTQHKLWKKCSKQSVVTSFLLIFGNWNAWCWTVGDMWNWIKCDNVAAPHSLLFHPDNDSHNNQTKLIPEILKHTHYVLFSS